MADRFGDSSSVLIESLKDNAKNKNTKLSTNNWLRVWKTWAKEKGHDDNIESYEPAKLNKVLEQFYATVRKQDGSDYEPDSLRVMVASLDRHLKENGFKYSILRDREFAESKQVLEGKAKQLRQEGKGKRPQKSRSLTTNEETQLWEQKKLGNHSPQVVTQTVWWLLTQHFGLRGRQENHSMQTEDFTFGIDENGAEYVEFVENPTKTRQSGLSAKPRTFLPKMFATGDDKCPVKIFKEFLSHRPREMQTTGPLYLSCIKNPSSKVWFKKQPMGENKINEMMKSIIQGSTLENSTKRFSNHSARKTVVKKLKTAGLERSSIVKVTGHRNEKSLDDYDESDEVEQRQLSHAISNNSGELNRSTNTINPFHAFSNPYGGNFAPYGSNFAPFGGMYAPFPQGLCPPNVQVPISGQNDQRQNFMNMNSFTNCQVTFNMGLNGNSTPEIKPAEKPADVQ